jgi:hypothetical protein
LASEDCHLNIRIISLPSGEAPEEVRCAWVGLVLPLAKGFGGPIPLRIMGGVLTGTRSPWIAQLRSWLGLYRYRICYAVPVIEAVEILEKGSPEAAGWWRDNTPHLFKPDQLFAFEAEQCEPVKV